MTKGQQYFSTMLMLGSLMRLPRLTEEKLGQAVSPTRGAITMQSRMAGIMPNRPMKSKNLDFVRRRRKVLEYKKNMASRVQMMAATG